MEPAANASIPRTATPLVPTFYIIEIRTGPPGGSGLPPPSRRAPCPKGSEEALLLGAFLRQAVLSLHPGSGHDPWDAPASPGQQRCGPVGQHPGQPQGSSPEPPAPVLMADLVGLFSPESAQAAISSFPFPGGRGRSGSARGLHPPLGAPGSRPTSRSRSTWSCGICPGSPFPWPRHRTGWHGLPSQPRIPPDPQPGPAGVRRTSPQQLMPLPGWLQMRSKTALLGWHAVELVGEILRFLDVFLLRINGRMPLDPPGPQYGPGGPSALHEPGRPNSSVPGSLPGRPTN